eukprot:CAMPEP_0198110026 /NCGR_PEP_ID=MMETSP1442-20131203/2058_1 /TAXON_ID= /ORGANISM="Craspedostauros australis, Strain CCMP3328" /LENGTH=54 /DNA_ID=CAMNT_0043765919 /DNA_START=110 /DNA_END=271 /DNA_ORIENTATION=+
MIFLPLPCFADADAQPLSKARHSSFRQRARSRLLSSLLLTALCKQLVKDHGAKV